MQTKRRFFRLIALLAALAVANGLLPVHAALTSQQIVLENIASKPIQAYAQPSMKSAVVQTFTIGQRMTWTGDVQQAEGRNWMPVDFGQRNSGWVSPDNESLIIVDPYNTSPGMDIGSVFKVGANGLAVHADALIQSQVTSQAAAGTQFKVLDGPQTPQGMYSWWQVSSVGSSSTGWIADDGYTSGLEIVQPLQVYGTDVCSGFYLRTFGVAGWDSFMKVLPSFIPAGDKVVCLASSNFKGDGSPVVTVLSRVEGTTADPKRHDTVRLFAQQSGNWSKIYEQTTDDFAITVRLWLHDFADDGKNKPMLLWTVMQDGTGHVLAVRLLNYDPVAGVQSVLSVNDLYQGNTELALNSIALSTPDYPSDEPNCCHAQIIRTTYNWQNGHFEKGDDVKIITPYYIQGFPPELKLKP
ncbi:MAG TPA: hypothetical protein VKQ72_01015 [Aggregatilineales bacterium]|nr:hypothetical protein [Aggregatilineales bacterium]